MKKIILGMLFTTISFSGSIHAAKTSPATPYQNEEEIKQRMASDLDTIRNLYDVTYAPADWKKELFGWDLDIEIDKAKQNIFDTPNITTKAYQRIVRDFLNSMRDYHVSAYFYSTEKATLPFMIKGAEGRYFFSFIDYSQVSAETFPCHV
jgi:hypothetical protein